MRQNQLDFERTYNLKELVSYLVGVHLDLLHYPDLKHDDLNEPQKGPLVHKKLNNFDDVHEVHGDEDYDGHHFVEYKPNKAMKLIEPLVMGQVEHRLLLHLHSNYCTVEVCSNHLALSLVQCLGLVQLLSVHSKNSKN